MKTVFLKVTFLLFLSCTIVGCKNKKDESAQDQLNVGVILPLTGELSSYGIDAKKAIDLGQQMAKQKIKLIYEDSKADPKTAINAYNKLIRVNKVDFVVGDLLSNTSLAIAPIANSLKKLTVSPTASSHEINNYGVFSLSLYPSEIIEGVAVARIAQKNNAKRIAVLYQLVSSAESMANSFQKTIVENFGGDCYIEGIDSKTMDYRNVITKVKNYNPDAIFLVTYPEVAIVLLNQIKENDIKALILGQSALKDDVFLEKVKSIAEGMILTGAYFSEERDDDLMRDFSDLFRSKYGHNPGMFAAQSYDALNFCLQNYKRFVDEKSININEIVYDGITGKTRFDKTGAVIKEFSTFQVINGIFKLIN